MIEFKSKIDLKNYFMDALSFALEELELQSVEKGFKVDGTGAWFIFDLSTNTCQYICPSISSITGLNPKNYTSQGMIYFLRNVIHPEDFIDIIAYLQADIAAGSAIRSGKFKYLTVRIKHRQGHWLCVRCKIYKARKKQENTIEKLIGYIQKDIHTSDLNDITSPVTRREHEILQLVSDGLSSKIIADKLNISETTAIAHRKNLIQKFQVKNTAELIKKAAILKLIN